MNERYKIRSVGGAAIITVPQHVMRNMRWQIGDKIIFDIRQVAGEKAVVVLPDKPSPNRKAGR